MVDASLYLEIGDYKVTVVAKTVTIRQKGAREVLSKTYATPQAVRVIVGRLMSAKTNEAFLHDLVRRMKKDAI